MIEGQNLTVRRVGHAFTHSDGTRWRCTRVVIFTLDGRALGVSRDADCPECQAELKEKR